METYKQNAEVSSELCDYDEMKLVQNMIPINFILSVVFNAQF